MFNQAKKNLLLKALVDDEHKLIMDWNEKAGCTIMVKMFFEHMGLLEEALSYSNWVHNYRQQVFSKSHKLRVKDMINSDYCKFKVVRNPYSRAISSFLTVMKQINFRLPQVYNKHFDKNKQDIMNLLASKTSDLSFTQFVSFLEKIDVRDCDNHFEQQRKWYEGFVQWDKVCKLENIEADIESVNQMAGTSLKVGGKSSAHHFTKDNSVRINVSDIPWSQIKDHTPQYNYFYTEELIRRVERLYSEDLQAYNYSYEDFLQNLR